MKEATASSRITPSTSKSKRWITGKGEKVDVPYAVQDMISAFYYARTFDLQGLNIGDTLTVPTFLDNELFPLSIKYLGDENVRIKKGKFRCMKFAPVVQKGRIFKTEEDLTVYITKDQNRIPIMAKAQILVGSIKMELTDYEGLKNPVARVGN